MEYGYEPENPDDKFIKITCAGMPERCYEYVDFDNFEIGSSYIGKLQQKHVRGGVILKDTEFTIKSN
jgi:hypothetical protein